DPPQIEQVLINLIQNAIQAKPRGGTLKVGLYPDGHVAAIRVQDTGLGIPPENLRRIFDPFFTTKPEGEGTGLGLSVSYGIISNHGGEINVESVVGQSTTFTVCLPLNRMNLLPGPEGTEGTAEPAGTQVPAGFAVPPSSLSSWT